jgi:HEAT repeat protein
MSFTVPPIILPPAPAAGPKIVPKRPEPEKPESDTPPAASLASAPVDPLAQGRVVSWSPVGTWRRRRELLRSARNIALLLAIVGAVAGIAVGTVFLAKAIWTSTPWGQSESDKQAAQGFGQPPFGGPSAQGSIRPEVDQIARDMPAGMSPYSSPGTAAAPAVPEDEVQALARQYGADKVVTISVEGVPEGQTAFIRAKIREASGLAGILRPSTAGTVTVVVAPIAYTRGVANRIDFGQVTGVDPAGRTISVKADPARFPEPIKPEATNPAHADYLKANLAELKCSDPDRRCQAAERLKQANAKDNRDEIAKALVALMGDNDPLTRRAAVQAWAACQTEATTGEALEALAKLAADPDSLVRSAAWETWGSMTDPRAVAAAAKLLRDESTRSDASRCLTKMGPAAEQAMLECLDGDDPGARHAAAEVLAQIATKRCTPVLVKHLQGTDDELAKDALRILAKLKDEKTIDAVAAVLDNPALGADAVRMLVAMGPVAEKAVVAVAKRGDKESLGRAVEVLDKIGTAECVPVVVQAAASDDSRVFWTAFRILQRLKDERSIVPMAELLASWRHRGHAAEVLKAIGPPAEDVLIKGLKHRNADVVMQCIEILGAIGTKKSLARLAPLTRHRSAWVRDAATKARTLIAVRSGVSEGGFDTDAESPAGDKAADEGEENPFRPVRPAGEKKGGEKKRKKPASTTIE